MTTELYRHFDADNNLLYVGISTSAIARLSGHKTYSEWFDKITVVTIERFPTREQALIAEKAIIIAEKPIFNVVHGTSPRGVSGTVGLFQAAEMLGIKPGVLRTDIIHKRCVCPPLPTAPNTRVHRWAVCQIEAYLATRDQ